MKDKKLKPDHVCYSTLVEGTMQQWYEAGAHAEDPRLHEAALLLEQMMRPETNRGRVRMWIPRPQPAQQRRSKNKRDR